jgi:hypothetical protein
MEHKMEIIVGISFIGLAGYLVYRKFRNVSKGKDYYK